MTTKNKVNDPVNHPSHYTNGRFEVIDIIEDQLGMEGLRGFCLSNTLKYIMRSGKKDPDKDIQDLEKGAWYLNHYIERLKSTNETQENKGFELKAINDLKYTTTQFESKENK